MFNKKYSIFLSLLITLLLIITGCSSKTESTNGGSESKSEDSGKKITLKMATAHAATHSFNTGLNEVFIEKVEKLTDGQVEIEFYPSEQLGKASDLLKLAKDGATDIAYYASPYYPSNMPIGSSLIGLPGQVSTSYQGSMAYQTISQKSPILESDFLSNGVRPIATYVTSTYDFFTKGDKIQTPADLKGRKVRSPGGVSHELLEFVGATPVSVTTPEMYEGFEKGVLDTIYSSAMSAEDVSLGELIKFGTNGVSYGASAVGLVINNEVFEGLPKNVQEAIIQAGNEVTEEYSKFVTDENNKVMQDWSDKGITIHALTEKEKEKWQKTAQEFTEQYLSKHDDDDFKKAVNMLKEEAKKYE